MGRANSIRIRQLLLAGTSGLALMAAATGAEAANCFGGGNQLVINHPGTFAVNSGTNCVLVASSFSGGVVQSGTLQNPGGITFQGATITSGFYAESGSNLATTVGGMLIDSNSIVEGTLQEIKIATSIFEGGLTNAGTISASGNTGIYQVSPTFLGGITNEGSITAGGGYGIWDGPTSSDNPSVTFSGGIINAPTTLGEALTPAFIKVTGSGNAIGIGVELISTFTGGITNNGTITVAGFGAVDDIDVANISTFSGGIVNTGQLTAAGGRGIFVGAVPTFLDGVTNSGSITASGGDGILLQNVQQFSSGAIVNETSGLIQVSGGSVAAISVQQGGTFDGDGIRNRGVLRATGNTVAGVAVAGTVAFEGGIANTGTISASGVNAAAGIALDPVSFFDGVFNVFGGTIVASAPLAGGIVVGGFLPNSSLSEVQDFEDGITSDGIISALGVDGGAGIGVIGVALFDGSVTVDQLNFEDSGGGSATVTVTGKTAALGVAVALVSTFIGGVSNAGTISTSAASYSVGIGVASVGTFFGTIDNAGTISATGGVGIEVGAPAGLANIIESLAPNNEEKAAATSAITFAGVPTFIGTISNSGIIVAGTGIAVLGSSVSGEIYDQGEIDASSHGILIDSASTIAGHSVTAIQIGSQIRLENGELANRGFNLTFLGGILNAGTILGHGESDPNGITVYSVSTFGGGITNSGSILVDQAGIAVNETATFSGGITNAVGGLITGGTGIVVGGAGDRGEEEDDRRVTVTVFEGGITNAGQITAANNHLFDHSAIGIDVLLVSTFAGGIHNSGQISGELGIGVGVYHSLGDAEGGDAIDQFNGGISNDKTGVIVADTGIWVGGTTFHSRASVNTFNGGITNAGTLISAGGEDTGIGVAGVATFNGGITNSGAISNFGDGIQVGGYVYPASDDPDTDTVVAVGVGNFNGGITNAGSGLIIASIGIQVGGAAPVTAIDDGSQTTAVFPSVSLFTGGIVNAGTIDATEVGVGVDSISTFTGGITNAGTISGAQIGVAVGSKALIENFGVEFTGSVRGAEQTTISSNPLQVQSFAGGITNAGTISAVVGIGVGDALIVTTTSVSALSEHTDVTTSLPALPAVITFAGGITNAGGGLIVANTGIAIGGSTTLTQISDSEETAQFVSSSSTILSGVSIFTGGITNAGTIKAGAVGIDLISVSTFSGTISNSGTISAPTGILIGPGAGFAGGAATIANSGNIVGVTAIDVHQAIVPVTINQTGGTIGGNIALSANGDTVNISGGAVKGIIEGHPTAFGANAGTVNFNLGAAGSFTTGGTIDVASVNINSGSVTLTSDISVFGTVTNKGTLSFGSSGGTYNIVQVTQRAPQGVENALVVPPAYIQTSTGNLLVAVSPASASLLNITGSAQLGGTVTFVYAPGKYVATIYPFLTASGGLGGTMFATAAGTAPSGFTQMVTYTPTPTASATTANLVLGAVVPPPTPTPTPAPPPPPPPPVIVAPQDATIYSAESFAFAQGAQNALGTVLGRTLPEGGGNTFYNIGGDGGSTSRGWMQGIGWEIDPAGFRANTGGLQGGIDHDFAPGLRLGVSAGYTWSNLSDSAGGNATQGEAFVALYGSQTVGNIGFSGALAYAHSQDGTARASGLGPSNSSNHLDDFLGAAQISAPFNTGGLIVTPAAGVYISDVFSSSFQEVNTRSSAFAVTGASSRGVGVAPFATLGLSHNFTTGDGMVITPDVMGGFQYDGLSVGLPITLIAQDGTQFAGNQIGLSQSSGLFRGSVTAHKGHWTAFVSYEGEVGSSWYDQTVTGGFRVSF
ncbi:MAG TPA: autotransporter outer membrane beta-barrel domain-containing protein [Caulobacteraceae bacterium]